MSRPVVAHRARIRVGCINIPFKVRRWAWRRCFVRTLERSDVFGVNEAFTVRQRALYRKFATARGFGYYGTNGPNPIFWNAEKYRLVSGRRIRIHPAGTSRRARLFRGYNAAREVTAVVLESLAHPGDQIAILNTHWAPGGPRVPAQWRAEMIEKSEDLLEEIIARQIAAGRPTFTIGDFNIYRAFVLGTVRWLRGRGVDKVGVAIPNNVRIEASRAYTYAAPTDHRHGVVGIVRLIVYPRST